MDNLYYKPLTDEQFEEVKSKSIKIWKTYDDTHGYATEKIERVNKITNLQDNAMSIIAMFDLQNQAKLSRALSEETRKAISDRMVAGGNPPMFNPFLI